MGDVLRKFGRYFLLDHLAQGGMAEIYRARLASPDGATRLTVIKKIQAGYGNNAEFLQMFKSEIKVTMGFNHPNIVQLYDFGQEEGQPYIAMELVDGKNLRQFINRFGELKQTFPVELAAYIAEQASSGLQYAHSFKDRITGISLNIVHRDISPQNILISFEGNVKVIDFGIAKATTNSEATRAGVIKGKPSYLSPEQISGETLDGRSDIFALGTVLWELLTGKKLFSGENDLAVLKLIESCQTHIKPPSTLNPKIPKELDYIVLKSLAKQRDKRYQNAEELQRALHKFLYSFMPEFNPSDLSYYAKDLFKNEIVEDRKRLQKLNDKVEQLLLNNVDETPHSAQASPDPVAIEESKTIVNVHRVKSSGGREISNTSASKEQHVEMEAPTHDSPPTAIQKYHSRNSVTAIPSATLLRPSKSITGHSSYSGVIGGAPTYRSGPHNEPKRNWGKITLLGVIALILLSVFGPDYAIKVPILSDLIAEWFSGDEAKLTLNGNEKNISVIVNGKIVASSLPATLNGFPVGTPFKVMVTSQHGTFQQDITLRKGESKTVNVTFSSGSSHNISPTVRNNADKTILLKINVIPGGGLPNITLNGQPVAPTDALIQTTLDSPLELIIERNGFRTFKREFVLESQQLNGLKEWVIDAQLEPLSFGFVTIHTTPSANAIIMMEGVPWIKKTPIENEKLPIGKYTIKLKNDVLGMEKTVDVEIAEGKSITIDERLEVKN